MKRKIALVLEGGGFRGCYTAGALSWLYEHDIEFEYVVSISATAVFSFYYAVGDMKNLHDISVKAVTDSHMIGLNAILTEGSICGFGYMRDTYIMPTYPKHLETLQKSDIDFEIGVYNMTQQELQYKNKFDLDPKCDLLKASCVLPISGKMTPVDGQKYLDGGIDTMVSVQRAKNKGYDKQLVIVTKDKNYVRKPNGWALDMLLKIVYHKYPNMLETLSHRVDAYYNQMGAVYELEKQGKGILIRPSRDCGVKRFSGTPEQLEDMFQLGWQDMEDRKSEILKFVEN